MFEPILVAWITTVFLALASIADLRTGEIPEKISWGLSLTILALALTQTITTSDATPLISSIGIGTIFFGFAYVVYRMGQWGGGDVKLMGGIGCSLGLMDAMNFIWPNTRIMAYPVSYIVAMGFLALPYAIIYSLYLSTKKPEIITEFRKQLKELKTILLIACSFSPALITWILGYTILAQIYILFPATMFSLVFLKAVEEK
ncbi:MAG: prepilin peptidase, partial [Candidatus Altiarchaeota archaeon]